LIRRGGSARAPPTPVAPSPRRRPPRGRPPPVHSRVRRVRRPPPPLHRHQVPLHSHPEALEPLTRTCSLLELWCAVILQFSFEC
jgi:hypothetical protein